MTEEKKVNNGISAPKAPAAGADVPGGKANTDSQRSAGRRPMRRRNDGNRMERPQEEYEQRILDLARVTRVMAGGKRMRFRACVALGNRKGKIGIGLAKGADVTLAVTKAVNKAKKAMIDVSMVNATIPHEVYQKTGAAKILFKPARKGRGVIAGGIVRVVLELAGIENVTSKILGTNNKVNNAKCVIEALRNLKKIENKKEEKPAVPAEEKQEEKKEDKNTSK